MKMTIDQVDKWLDSLEKVIVLENEAIKKAQSNNE